MARNNFDVTAAAALLRMFSMARAALSASYCFVSRSPDTHHEQNSEACALASASDLANSKFADLVAVREDAVEHATQPGWSVCVLG